MVYRISSNRKCPSNSNHPSFENRTNHIPLQIVTTPRLPIAHFQYYDVIVHHTIAYEDKYSKWMASGQKSYTAASNMCAPSRAQCLKWVKECWSSLSTELIQKPFHSCGISMNVNGSEDAEIYCLKAGEVAAFSCSSYYRLYS